jgi:3-oxoacyl-[acyl-carrier protein] reductase
MDLGLRGRRAVVCGSSRGLGRACAEALAAEGVDLVVNGRDAEAVATAADTIAATHGVQVTGVAADIDTIEGRADLLAAGTGADILVTNNAGPPPMAFADTDPEAWRRALDANLLAPVYLLQALLPAMRERRFGRVVNITSAMVTSPNPMMTLSVGARTGLTGVMKAISKEVVCDNVTINNILPERIDTGRQRQMAEIAVAVKGISLEEAYAEIAATVAAGRLGRPEEVGAACAFLCSAQAGFISGQNLHLDGGSYPGVI